MPGHVHKRIHTTKSGKESVLYYAVVELPQFGDRRKQDWGPGFRRKKDAEAELVEKLAKVNSGEIVARSDLTVGECLQRWLTSTVGRVKPTTFDSYRRTVNQYLTPHIGTIKLQQLRPVNVQQLSELLLENGGLRTGKLSSDTAGSKPLAPKTVRNHLNVLGAALKHALAMGWIANDPMAAVKKPSARRRKEMKVWDANELVHFLGVSTNHELFVLFRLVLYTGLRRSEVLGLRWNDIDLQSRRLAVRQTLVVVGGTPQFGTPKSHEARTIDLDPETTQTLSDWRQEQARRLDGLRPAGDLVFTRADGHSLHPDTVSDWFRRCLHDCKIERTIAFHEMRHTHASLLLREGVPVHVVSQRLGHADVGFTLRTYAHVMPGMQAEAAVAFANSIGNTSPTTDRTGR